MAKQVTIFDSQDYTISQKFNLLSRLYLSTLSKQLKHMGLERHFSVLALIHHLGDRCCQQQISDALEVDKATMVGIMDDLCEKGFVKRLQNPSDKRRYWIQLTSKGEKNIPEIMLKVNELNRKITLGVGVEDLNTALKLVYKNLLRQPPK